MKGKDYLIFAAGAALLCAGWYLLNIVEDTSVRFPGKRVRYFRLQSEPYFYPLSDEKISGDR